MRVKNTTTRRRKHKDLLVQTKGYRLGAKNLYREAKERLMKAWTYAYRDRKTKKRDFRSLWILRIKAAANNLGVSYSKLTCDLNKNNIKLNRKMLSELAIHHPALFEGVVNKVK